MIYPAGAFWASNSMDLASEAPYAIYLSGVAFNNVNANIANVH